MSRNRIFLIGGILIASAGVGWHYFQSSIAPNVDATYTAGNFTAAENGKTYAFDGVSNLLIGSFTLPNPLSDALIVDGATNVLASKHILTGFPSNNKMYDTDNSNAFGTGEGIVLSTDAIIGPNDVVLLTGLNALQTPPTAESSSLLVYFDQGATSGSYDPNEDIYRQVFSGPAGTITDGSTAMRTFENTLAFIDVNSDSVIGFGSISTYHEPILLDADADSKPSAGDSVVASGDTGAASLSSSTNVCFDGSVVNDTEYDVNEIVWLDVAGDCSAFTTGVDGILLGNAVPSGTSTEFGTEGEVGYIDTNASGTYNCVRAGSCEPLFYSGMDGTNVGAALSGSNIFFDSSTEATDGIHTTGTAWDEAGGSENLVNVSTLVGGGESTYVYVDANANSNYSYDEDIFINAVVGTTTATATGQTLRLFDAQERIMMNPGTAISGFNASSGAIVLSTDLHLTLGALDGTGTDRVLSPGIVLDPMPAAVKYFDHDLSGPYVFGDDIAGDIDASGYFNADDLLSTQVVAASSPDIISDSYLTAIKIYQRVGNECAGSGTDTLVGSDVSTPFLGQAISITKAPYAVSDAVATRTLCVYADIADNGVHGKIWQLVLPTNGVLFSSGASPSSDFTVTSAPVQFAVNAPVTMTSTSSKVGQSASYTFTYTLTEDGVTNGNGLLDVTFPATFNVSASTVTCTDDGSSVSLTLSIASQLVRAVNASGSTVATGSVVSCTVSGVTNSSTTGTSGAFTIGADAGSTSLMTYVDTDNTISLSPASSSDSSSTPIANVITLTSPNGGESIATGSTSSITWSTTGTGISYVNISYSLDSGLTWSPIATNEANDSSYSWTVPSASSSLAMIKVEGADLVTIVDDDVSDAVFSIASSSGSTSSSSTTTSDGTASTPEASSGEATVLETPVEEIVATTSTLTWGIYVKLATSPTVYAIDSYLVRHAFFDAQTFFTYQSNFDGVLTVDEDTLDQSTLGDPMPVNPKTILVRFGDSSSVYTTNTDTDGVALLRPISDSATAITAMGDKWEENVITLESEAFGYYRVSSEGETSTSLADWASSAYLTNKWHLMYADAINDPDGDGAATWIEAMWGTSPYDPDTDNDGYNDWLEVETGHNPFVSGGV